ncbi:MAG: hypothetical protein WBA07_14135 [Rivularia sp. (in: cyanobacteria)]
MTYEKQKMFEVCLQEYNKLKDEQNARIGFRDNLLYVTLGVFGSILSFALSDQLNPYALLVLPWVCLILGWTYLVNDQKISALGKYIRGKLTEKISLQIGYIEKEKSIFGWEIEHRIDEHRKRRKIEQLIIDEITFVFSGMAGLIAFNYLAQPSNWAIQFLWWVQIALLIILGVEILVYADLGKG